MMNILLSLLIFLLPFGVLFRLSPAPNIFIYPHDVVAGLIFILFVLSLAKGKKVKEGKIFLFACLFLSIGLLSLIINSKYLNLESFIASFAYLARFTAYLSIIFAIQLLPPTRIDTIKRKLLLSGALFVLFGFIQYFFFPTLIKLYNLGWDEHRSRLFSTMFDPNFAGAYIVLIAILVFGTILEASKQKNKSVLKFSLFLTACIVAIFLTHSRSALIAFLAGGISILLASKMYKFIFYLLFIIAVGSFVFSNASVESLNLLRVASVEARIGSAKESFSIFVKNPFLGVGFNTYRYSQKRYLVKPKNYVQISNSDAGTDNSYLFILATTGVIGFSVCLGLIVTIFMRIYRITTLKTIWSRIVIASIIAILVDTVFNNSLFYTPVMAWMFILIGVTLNKKR